MYTTEQYGHEDPVTQAPDAPWAILDPEGDEICTVRSESQAFALLSHLNRG